MRMSNVLGLAVLSTVLAGVSPASADKCNNVNFDVKNGKTTKIKALSVEYKFVSDNTWRSEAFGNVEVGAGATKRVANSQDLADGEGERMFGLKLHFQAWCGGKWSKEFVSQVDSTFDDTTACKTGRTYRVDVPYSNICEQL